MSKESAQFVELARAAAGPPGKQAIESICITARPRRAWDAGPRLQAVWFHRSNRARYYIVSSASESFYRAVRALRRLAVREPLPPG